MEPNGEISKLRAYMALIKEAWDVIGLPTLLLLFVMSLWVGWLPSPLSAAKDIVTDLKASLEQHMANDDEVLFYLRQMCQANVKLAGMPVEDCNWRPHR